MSAQPPLFQTVLSLVHQYAPTLTKPIRVRLALLVVGMLVARSAVLRDIAAVLDYLGLTEAEDPESIERRLRRTLSSPTLVMPGAYQGALAAALGFDNFLETGRPLFLIIDETNRGTQWHMLAVRVAHRGAALPVAFRLGPQNQKLAKGAYWQHVHELLAEVRAWIPAGVRVIGLADRAYDLAKFIDTLGAVGFSYIIRLKANSRGKLLDTDGAETEIRAFFTQRLSQRGMTWSGTLRLFKKAKWRSVQVAGCWEAGHRERLVVISDCPLTDPLLEWYEFRFWIEASFRNEKRAGFDWEHSQVPSQAHQERLVLGMAWGLLLATVVGEQEAEIRLARRAARAARQANQPPQADATRPKAVAHARDSLFRLGLRAIFRFLVDNSARLPAFRLRHLHEASWYDHWERENPPAHAA